MAKGLPRSTRSLTQSFAGGIRADVEAVTSVSGGSVALGSQYESQIRSSGGQTTDTVTLPTPTTLGQRKVVTLSTEAHASDLVRVNAASGDAIVREGFNAFSGVSGFAEGVVANVDLASGASAALFEYRGLSGTTQTWHLLYTTGSVSLS